MKKKDPNLEKTKNELLKEYFCAVTLDDIMTIDRLGGIKLDGEKLSSGEALGLYEEARYFQGSRLYKILMNSLRDQAQKVMYEKSESFDDMRNGKMMLYNLSVQENIIDAILKYGSRVG